ncbi:chemotaxis protein CheA [Alkaliphilus hydrothermalis]|uniref:Chemotaxis protein CheA n=1 Tax=Alkaliphilus hydrothermalis TaxID=1482730 RepID=A0ABS2NL72_9FIRM|nr:chemotaxis protein CheA [Alkaliphilus hydrothermalis]MBM7613681.1 two-component system chemotaxis sensor kinase CheA [Alkaliphilus hydrothermalis]
MDMNQYMDIFIEESKEHLQSMNQILLQMENSPGDMDMLNEIFRIAHTLKGMSSTMGFQNIAHLTHEMENVLDAIRGGKMAVHENIIDILFNCFDELENYINLIETEGSEGPDTSAELIQVLASLKDSGGIVTKEVASALEKEVDEEVVQEVVMADIEISEYVHDIILTAISKELNPYYLKITLDSKCMLKSARAYIIINTLEKLSDVIYSNPSIEDLEDEKFDLDFQLILISKVDASILEKELESISEIHSFDIIRLQENYTVIKEDSDTDIDINIKLNMDHEETSIVHEEMGAQNPLLRNERSDESRNKRNKTGKTVRVDIDRLDNLMNLVSELIIIKTRLEDIDDTGRKEGQNMHDAIEYLERITTSLHDAVMKVRMVPIERVFNRFPRMVRDLSKELGKEISLFMSGEDTEVDRTVIDEIGDPLIHLIRNSIDHGIEDPATREKGNKNKSGTVRLVAYPDGNSVVIEVEDDGKGINIDKVKAKALERGVITPQQSHLMEDKDIIQLLFHPGFSTADKISDISGRGVGLDVVKTKIETLGGVVEVDTKQGQGSKFTIRLPLTLAIIQALLVTVGSEKYAIPLNSIKEITTIQANTIRKVQNHEVVLYRNATLPILKLSNILNVTSASEDHEEYVVVIVKKGDKTVGVVVDHLVGQQEIVIKSLGKYLANIKAIAGATILGNGSVALIVDTNSFF